MLIPGSQDLGPARSNEALDRAKLTRREAEVPRSLDGGQPELRGSAAAIHVNVGRLAEVMAVEV
jgi:hypothetical protein